MTTTTLKAWTNGGKTFRCSKGSVERDGRTVTVVVDGKVRQERTYDSLSLADAKYWDEVAWLRSL